MERPDRGPAAGQSLAPLVAKTSVAPARTLTDADVEAVARRVAELLDQAPAVDRRYLTAAEVARLAGRSRAWVYENAELLGGAPLPGGGRRPRLHFDRERVEQALATGSRSRRSLVAASRAARAETGARRKPAKGTTRHLLPIHGQEAA